MLRPSASAAKVSALAAESMSASFGWMIGNSTASANTVATTLRERRCGATQATGDARRSHANDSPIIPVLAAGALVRAILSACPSIAVRLDRDHASFETPALRAPQDDGVS